ncbi:MAG TPA: ribosome maturation factor RimP [Sedimenticola thiotaurini]|uniref:Ribosome maturation factor RimP n=1 Tax=Sedimenticola thiotaurini TaxID=1543721 RepID=A0A831RJ27_9GAMM|nr:ribosome maturation factor RimP [Sedimenticola thiotaurini]
MTGTADGLTRLIESAVVPMGYELVGVEYLDQGHGGVLRVYIDHADGISVDDCARVSHQVSGLLDVEDPIPGNYSLEVSSPGLDRPLFGKRDFDRFAGRRVSLRTREKIAERRRFKGLLRGTEGDDVLVEVDGETFRLPLDRIDKARLVPDF